MTRFVVLEPPPHRPREDTVLVRDRFQWLAFVFPVLWLLWHRLWLPALGWVVAAAALAFALHLAGSGMTQAGLLALGAIVALEGPAWRIARLRRLGFVDVGTIHAERLDDAERLYAEGAPRGPAATGQDAAAPATQGRYAGPHAAAAGRQAERAARTLLDPIGT